MPQWPQRPEPGSNRAGSSTSIRPPDRFDAAAFFGAAFFFSAAGLAFSVLLLDALAFAMNVTFR